MWLSNRTLWPYSDRMTRFDGSSLARQRKRARLSQAVLGVRVGMEESYAQQVVSAWERGLKTPPVNVLPRLAQVLDCGIRDFFTDPEVTHSAENPGDQHPATT